MKNIHVLPTDKPSSYVTNYMEKIMQWQNIYITSDEEIKEGWSYDRMMRTVNKIDNVYSSKIILTTDPQLIEDGVQAIDDEFLEWFVNNPSCDSVKIDLVPVNEFGSEITVGGYGFDKFKYKIIIPQEEPNQSAVEEIAKTKAFEFKIDYKPFETDLDYREYAEYGFKKGFIDGTKCQSERSYNKEEVDDLLDRLLEGNMCSVAGEELIEKFQKK
jgi:hypothetical protein